MRERIAAAKMPADVEKEATRELERLETIPQASPEYSVTLDYLEWLVTLPWSVSTEDQLDLEHAARVLDEDHYDLEKVKKRILEFLAVRMLRKTQKTAVPLQDETFPRASRSPILCFIGPPGVGKTSLGQSIARATGRKFIRMSLGGMRDEAEIRGHRRTYIGALPGRIIQEIRKAGTHNPVFMLDEVDKVGADFRGDPSSALLEVLDPSQNYSFVDHYLDVPFDLSRVLFIATANYTDTISPPLRDRMEVITLSGYTQQEKLFIAKRYLVPRQLAENGLTADQVQFDDDALLEIIYSYTREAGVRNLEREIGSVCRARAAAIVGKKDVSLRVTRESLADDLGPPRFESEVAASVAIPGVVTGLAFTPVGGEILFIEANRMPGNGSLNLTGQIGNVMRESAQAAFSIVRARAESWKIDPQVLRDSDFHVHVPAGAVQKDGPSAGVAMLTALVSLLTNRLVDPATGMTGEITLRGRVMPIGGVKEKVLAAHRAGLRRVILPEQNRRDLDEVPLEVRRDLEFVFVKTIDELLAAAFEARPLPAERPAASPSAPPVAASKAARARRTTPRVRSVARIQAVHRNARANTDRRSMAARRRSSAR
jgi:ATP-dependent Lon protease